MDSSVNAEKRVSDAVHVAKCFATLSIISAHITYGGIGAYPLAVLKHFSSLGVIIFFIGSAYYFHPDCAKSFSAFARKKGNTIIIPWLIMGSLVYLVSNLHGGLSIRDWLVWLLGYKTYLWYIPVLLCAFFLFYRFYSHTGFCMGCIGVSVVSLLLTTYGILEPIIHLLHITNYLFLPNWVGVFAVGCLLRKYDGIENLLSLSGKKIAVLAGIYLALLLLAAYIEPEASGYFSKFGLLLELMGTTLVLYLSGKIPCSRFLKAFSGCSYAVYLIHFIGILLVEKLFGFLSARFEWISLFYFIPVSLLVFALLLLGYATAKRIKAEKYYTLLTGIRMYQKEK